MVVNCMIISPGGRTTAAVGVASKERGSDPVDVEAMAIDRKQVPLPAEYEAYQVATDTSRSTARRLWS